MRMILFFMLLSHMAVAQQKFGIEIRSIANLSFNSQNENGLSIKNCGQGTITTVITNPSNLFYVDTLIGGREELTHDYSLGFLFFISDKSILKLHLGRHNLERTLIIESSSFFGNNTEQSEISLSNSFWQINPAYAYSFSCGKLTLPMEFGMTFNRNFGKLRSATATDWFIESRLAFGLEYSLGGKWSIGSNVVYTHGLNTLAKYSYRKYFKPYQIGLELNAKYFFSFTLDGLENIYEPTGEYDFDY